MPALALSRVGARVVESGPGGQVLRGRGSGWSAAGSALAAGADLPAGLPDRDRGLRVHRCDDRFTAVGQWIRRASQEDLARLRAPWDPVNGRYRAPDEKTIRVVLNRLDPRALARALLGPRPRGRRRPCGRPSDSVRGYHARRVTRQTEALARDRLRAVAVDGKTSRGARRLDGTRVHLLGVAEHGGRLLDHLEVDVKHNETSHFTALLELLDLDGAGDLRRPAYRAANLDWLASQKKAHYIAVVKQNQPLLHARVRALPCGRSRRQRHPRHRARPHRDPHPEGRPRQPPGLPARPPGHQDHPLRKDTATGKASRETAYAVTSLTSADATTQDLARLVREHWSIQAHHHIRTSHSAKILPPAGPAAGLPTWPPSAPPLPRPSRSRYLHIPEGRRDHTTTAETIRLHASIRQMRTFTEHAGLGSVTACRPVTAWLTNEVPACRVSPWR